MTSSGNFHPPKSEGASVQVHCADSNTDGKGVIDSVFRTNAWLEAWLATYGSLPQVTIIDPFGSGSIADYLYTYKAKALKVIPCQAMALVGCQSYGFASPRSEYNLPACLLNQRISLSDYICELKGRSWSLFGIPDLHINSSVLSIQGDTSLIEKSTSYQVVADSFNKYRESLGKNTRSRYFNKLNRLMTDYSVDFYRFDACKFKEFALLLNKFHIDRWGLACYSDISVSMFEQFVNGLTLQGGVVILEVMEVDGKPESVIFDVEWAGRRYNLQCGFNENFSSQLKLGSLHIGKAIRESVESNQVYDMLAGTGKNIDYKSSLANSTTKLNDLVLRRRMCRFEYWIKEKRSMLKKLRV